MPPSTKAAMAVLCAYCTVVAQKPSNVNNTATAVLPDTGQLTGGVVVQQQRTQPSISLTQGEQLSLQSEPSRIVLQATFVTDPRVMVCFNNEPGWCSPLAVPVTPTLSALSFTGNATNTASPVCFSNTETVTVQTLMLATRGDAADLATLADAPETARLRLVSDGSLQTEPGPVEQSLTQQFVPEQWQIVAVDFDAPVYLAGMTFGGSAGRPEWCRNWRGEISEIVGFDRLPDADIRAGVANYLAIRWSLASYPASPGQRLAAINAGLDYGLVWGSVLFFKMTA